MSAFVCGILVILFGVLGSSGQQENAGGARNPGVGDAVTKAVQWMLQQRGDDHSWAAFTPRAMVALSLSRDAVPFPGDEVDLMTKQLNILLSLELGRNLSTKSMDLSRLALYVNALFATCQDPRDFHGLDLVRILRTRTDAALTRADFGLPVVFVPLCLAQEVRQQDVSKIIEMLRNFGNKTDLQALTLLGLSCIAEQNRSAIARQYLASYGAAFLRHFHVAPPSDDVYTLALALQVQRAISGVPADASPLLEKQSPGGSFGSLLGTYYALPVLLGKNVYSIKDGHCSQKNSLDHSMSYPLSDPSSPKVYYSVWVGEGDARDSHTVTVTLPSNRTFFDIMQMAASRNPKFRFGHEETSAGKRVYSVGGTPNDVQRELRWMLYVTKGAPTGFLPHGSMQQVTRGVDRIYPSPEDHYVFWFRRHSLLRV